MAAVTHLLHGLIQSGTQQSNFDEIIEMTRLEGGILVDCP